MRGSRGGSASGHKHITSSRLEDAHDIQTAYKRDAADNLLEATIDHVLGQARDAFWETVAAELDELTDSGDFPVHHEFDVDAAMKQAIIVYIAINT